MIAEPSAPQGRFASTSARLSEHLRRGNGEMVELEDGAGERCEILLSGHDSAVALMNSQKR